jgi:glycosyltransferase involved in cell wall biosynthesis
MPINLPADLLGRLSEIGEADLVVGIPSYNNARTIGHVVRAVSAGLDKYFPEQKAIIVNSDGGSKDGTREAVLAAEVDGDALLVVSHRVHPIQRISTPYDGIPGKGSAFRTIFEIARQAKAKACAVVDSDLRSITPQWIELLVRPVLEREFDYIAPYYLRHKYDGTITNGIIYPITRALYGKRVRQPIGGDFGFSGRLAARYLEKDVWETDIARFGVDIWMTTTALAEGFRVGQAYLGAKLHDAKDPGADLTSMFQEVVGSVFALMETYQAAWRGVEGSEAVPMFGFPFEVGVEPIAVNVDRMVQAFVQGVRDLREIYTGLLTPETLQALTTATDAPLTTNGTSSTFHIEDALWVRVIYEFAAAWHHLRIDREHLLKSLVPLYLGRTASFVLEVRESSAIEVEERIEQLCLAFEAEKSFLKTLWAVETGKESSHARSDTTSVLRTP